VIAEKVDLINTVKGVALNVDVNTCVESRHVLHERPLAVRRYRPGRHQNRCHKDSIPITDSSVCAVRRP
jgi:hypothetical protein